MEFVHKVIRNRRIVVGSSKPVFYVVVKLLCPSKAGGGGELTPSPWPRMHPIHYSLRWDMGPCGNLQCNKQSENARARMFLDSSSDETL